jgi:hypothetical protein
VKWQLVLLVWVIIFTHIFQFRITAAGFLRYRTVAPQAVHRVSQQIRDLVGERGQVFTIPLYLVAGLPLDPHFVTGALLTAPVCCSMQSSASFTASSVKATESYLTESPDAILLGLQLFG